MHIIYDWGKKQVKNERKRVDEFLSWHGKFALMYSNWFQFIVVAPARCWRKNIKFRTDCPFHNLSRTHIHTYTDKGLRVVLFPMWKKEITKKVAQSKCAHSRQDMENSLFHTPTSERSTRNTQTKGSWKWEYVEKGINRTIMIDKKNWEERMIYDRFIGSQFRSSHSI